MTVATTNTKNTYSGDGTTATFAITFFTLDPTWVTAFLSGVSTSAFTVILNTNQSTTPGGTVTFTSPPPAGSANVVIQRVTPRTQLTNYTEYDAFPALSHMSALDKLTAEMQDLAATAGIGVPLGGMVGDVLTSDAFGNPLWATFISMFPPLVAGMVLGTDGSILEWVTGGGGGGGGIDTIGAPIASNANGALITGSELQLALNTTNPGAAASTPGISYGTGSNIHDIRNYGAVSCTSFPSGVVDCAPAFDAAIAAWSTNVAAGGIYVPEGQWFISRPICLPSLCKLFGDGMNVSQIYPGFGNSTTPSLVQGFGGPLIYTGISNFNNSIYPTYTSSLVGATGRSMELANLSCFYLHDAWGWSVTTSYATTLANTSPLAAMCLRCWANVQNAGNASLSLIGSYGAPVPWNTPSGSADSAFSITVTVNSGLISYIATLTTYQLNGSNEVIATTVNRQTIQSGTYATGTHNFEIDYNGSFFDFYIDGVNQGHVAMTGFVIRTPLEGISIGQLGSECKPALLSVTGGIDSIEFANVARHTGVGGFVPPTSKYAADGNTLALINFDQGDAIAGQPFIIGQTKCGTVGNLLPHYIRIVPQNNEAFMPYGSDNQIDDLYLYCFYYNTGIVGYNSQRCRIRNVYITHPSMYGVCQFDGASFYSEHDNIWVYAGANVGTLLTSLTSDRVQTAYTPCGQWYSNGGCIRGATHQLGDDYIPFVSGPSNNDVFSAIEMYMCSIDAEVTIPTVRTGHLVYGETFGSIYYHSNSWSTHGADVAPTMVWTGVPLTGAVVMLCDVLTPADGTAPCAISKGYPFNGQLLLINCANEFGGTPLTDTEGWITQLDSNAVNQQSGLSTGDAQRNNLEGTVTAYGTNVTMRCVFITPEPDTNYHLKFQAISHTGSSPAANSWNVTSYTPGTKGFTATVQAAPGSTCFLTFSWTLIGIGSPALLSVDVPALPSTYANPLSGKTGNFAAGITIVPTNGVNFFSNHAQSIETILESGTVIGGANYWEMGLETETQWTAAWSTLSETFIDSFVGLDTTMPAYSGLYNGTLYGLLNPGPHNVVIALQNGILQAFMDGGQYVNFNFGNPNLITQPANIYAGERFDTSQPLTSANALRHLRVDIQTNKVIVIEPDYGPLSTAAQAAFFGDFMTQGLLSTGTSPVGGYANQIANNRYPDPYYWFACKNAARIADGVFFWNQWGYAAQLEAICIMLGYDDLLLDSATSAYVLDGIRQIVEGTHASFSYNVPATGSATLVIDGVSFTSVFNTNVATTIANLIALVNANGTVNALGTASLAPSGNQMLWTALAFGHGGNGITATTNGANGAAVCITGVFPYISIVATQGGQNGAINAGVTTIVICTVPPFGNAAGYTVGKNTQRTTLNSAILAYTGAGVSIADADTTLRDPSAHQNFLPANLAADNESPNNTGHALLYTLIQALLP